MATSQTTTDFVKFGAAADAITANVYVQKFQWTNVTSSAGEHLQITNTAGTIIIDVYSNGVDKTYDIDSHIRPMFCAGIIVAAMSSGTLLAHLV